jgi:hypothetical protein
MAFTIFKGKSVLLKGQKSKRPIQEVRVHLDQGLQASP